jgi:hypothetical protein
VRSFLKGTFKGAQGNTNVEHITNPEAAETKTYLFYGESSTDQGLTGMNVIANFEPTVTGKIEEEWGKRYTANPSLGAAALRDFIQSKVGALENTYKTNLLSGGVIIETGPLPALEYAINWQQDCWNGATIDPTSMDTLIVPLPAGVKSENAYNRALKIAMPSTSGHLYFYTGETWGRTLDGSLAQNEDGCNRALSFVTWQNPFAPIDVKQYDRYLSDLTLPSFTITNQEAVTYSAFSDTFGSIYGDADIFFNTFGVDETITDTVSRRYYSGLMEPDYQDMNAMPWAELVFTWKELFINIPGAFLNGKTMSIPVVATDIPSGEKHPDQQEALYKYKYEYARINNAPDSVQQEFVIRDAFDAQMFRQATLTF